VKHWSYLLRNLQVYEAIGLNAVNSRTNQPGGLLYPAQIIGRKLEDGDFSARQILLVANILIGGDEQVEGLFLLLLSDRHF
jgi:hypothetical protein